MNSQERREEETEDGEKRIQTEEEENIGKCIELLPLDLTPDILLRLPAKSALRLRCVSKLWSCIATRPDFIKSFATRSSTRLRLLFRVGTTDNRRLFISLTQHEHPDTCYSRVERFQMNLPGWDYSAPRSGSVHGLFCYLNDLYVTIWNPTMRQHVTLPKPGVRFRSCFLGYDPVEDKHKVLCIQGFVKPHDPLVFTLGPQESWRAIPNSSPLHFVPYHMGPLGVCINGNLYYQARKCIIVHNTSQDEEILMIFDVRYEKFNAIRKPAADCELCGFLALFNYNGKLAWVCSMESTSLMFWVLEDEEKQEWSLQNFLLPFPTFPQSDPDWQVQLWLCGVTHDTGELIFVGPRFDAICVLYYDPKRNRTRRVKYEGFADKEFRNRDDFVNICRDIYWYPNHSESLTSLENVSPFD